MGEQERSGDKNEEARCDDTSDGEETDRMEERERDSGQFNKTCFEFNVDITTVLGGYLGRYPLCRSFLRLNSDRHSRKERRGCCLPGVPTP